MRPSEVRQLILDDHAALRVLFGELEGLLHKFEAGARELGPRIQSRGRDLRRRFLAHLALEEAHLVPALREADAWGEERVARLEREHAEQRVRLDELLPRLVDERAAGDDVVHELETLVHDLRADMEGEEEVLLSEKVLRDDPISIDLQAG